MIFHKDFNPGTGNTFIEWHIEHVEHLYPVATSVTTTHYHQGEKQSHGNGKKKMDDEQKLAVREEILGYVGQLTDCVRQEYRAKYATLWDKILDIPEVAEKVYDYGEQKNTNFNKQLIGNIIHLMAAKVLDDNKANLCRLLEGNDKHAIRGEMGKEPSEEIRKAVLDLLQHC